MAVTEAFSCDVCGKQKQDVNHWYFFWVVSAFTIRPWDDTVTPSQAGHLCGQECATKALSEWMSKQAEGAR